jgi:hypothetical protein
MFTMEVRLIQENQGLELHAITDLLVYADNGNTVY